MGKILLRVATPLIRPLFHNRKDGLIGLGIGLWCLKPLSTIFQWSVLLVEQTRVTFIAMTITTMMAPWWSYNRGDYCNKFTRFLPIFYGHLRHLIPLNLIPTKYPRKIFLESVIQNVTVVACRYYVVISGIFHYLTFSPRHT